MPRARQDWLVDIVDLLPNLRMLRFPIRRLASLERVRQRQAGQGSTDRSRSDRPADVSMLVTRQYAQVDLTLQQA